MTGIFGILLCLNQPVQYLIEMAIAVGVAFAVSFILYKDKKEDIKEQAEAVIPAEEIPVSQAETVTEETLGSPVSGKLFRHLRFPMPHLRRKSWEQLLL